MGQQARSTIVSSLALRLAVVVPPRIEETANTPRSAQHSCGLGVHEAGDEHGADGCGLVLEQVVVAALGAVEVVELLRARGGRRRNLLVRGAHVGVGNLGRFAELHDARAQVGGYEEGRGYGGEDVAVVG